MRCSFSSSCFTLWELLPSTCVPFLFSFCSTLHSHCPFSISFLFLFLFWLLSEFPFWITLVCHLGGNWVSIVSAAFLTFTPTFCLLFLLPWYLHRIFPLCDPLGLFFLTPLLFFSLWSAVYAIFVFCNFFLFCRISTRSHIWFHSIHSSKSWPRRFMRGSISSLYDETLCYPRILLPTHSPFYLR